ncbi:hypothetical protein ACFVH6_11395 [Spirillospora sp. NPDC127200]
MSTVPGNGKHADVMIEFSDGRQYILAVGSEARVSVCPGMEIDLTLWGDRSLVVRWPGHRRCSIGLAACSSGRLRALGLLNFGTAVNLFWSIDAGCVR